MSFIKKAVKAVTGKGSLVTKVVKGVGLDNTSVGSRIIKTAESPVFKVVSAISNPLKAAQYAVNPVKLAVDELVVKPMGGVIMTTPGGSNISSVMNNSAVMVKGQRLDLVKKKLTEMPGMPKVPSVIPVIPESVQQPVAPAVVLPVPEQSITPPVSGLPQNYVEVQKQRQAEQQLKKQSSNTNTALLLGGLGLLTIGGIIAYNRK